MDFSHYYHTRIKTSIDDDRAAIIAGFQDIVKRELQVACRLATYYKGLPINYPATIFELRHGTLELDVHQQQAFALEEVRRAFIKCDYFDSAMVADVQNVNVRRKAASLNNFTFVEIMAERRDTLRLELETPTDAEIVADSLKLEGKLLDLSLGGVSISTAERYPWEQGIEARLRIVVPNLLQNTTVSMDIMARHLDTIQESSDICRFSFQPDPQSEAVITRFILQRQVEIIRQIKEAS